MEYQKIHKTIQRHLQMRMIRNSKTSSEEIQKDIDNLIINLLDNTPHEPTTFRTKNRLEINDESRERYNKDNQIRFKTSVLCQVYVIIAMHIYLLKKL